MMWMQWLTWMVDGGVFVIVFLGVVVLAHWLGMPRPSWAFLLCAFGVGLLLSILQGIWHRRQRGSGGGQ